MSECMKEFVPATGTPGADCWWVTGWDIPEGGLQLPRGVDPPMRCGLHGMRLAFQDGTRRDMVYRAGLTRSDAQRWASEQCPGQVIETQWDWTPALLAAWDALRPSP